MPIVSVICRTVRIKRRFGLYMGLFQGITVSVFDGDMGRSEHKALRTEGCGSRGGGYKALKSIEKTRLFLNFKNGRASCW